MSTNVPEWVGRALAEARKQKVAHGKLIPGRERAPLTQREQAFLQAQVKKEADPFTAEAVAFDALDKLNKELGRQ